ncbi:hypothetical protein E3U23_10550 [Erythrobacter litoralis]|nr:hypothetical protein [Erythrobacter litoralis]
MARFTLIFVVAFSASTLSAKDSLGIFESWGAFRDAPNGRCYAIATPLPTASKRDIAAYASVGTWPQRRLRGQVYFKLGRRTRPGTRISLRVGNSWYKMSGSRSDVWAFDAQTNAAILAGMRSSQSMTIAAFDTRGNRFTDRYPLAGAATAIDAATLACGRK